MENYIAQHSIPIGTLSPGDAGIEIPDGETPVQVLAKLISTVIGLLTIIAVLYFIFLLLTGAVAIISSGGDEGRYENARKRITTGAIGLVVVISAMFLIGLIGLLLDLPYITNLQEMINRIRL